MKQKLLLFFFALLIFAIKSYGQITTIDCSMPPLTIDYCYGNENETIFTYVSNNGVPLRLTINSGEVEDGYDDLIVYDSDGITNLNGASPFGNDGDITGMIFQSTGDSIGLLVYSDSTVSCTSSSFLEGINYTVSCATCANPTVSYQMIPDCENGEQFYVDTQIASLGDADSLTVSNSINEEILQVFSTGTYQIGPFNLGESVVLTVSNDQDDNCLVSSNVLTLENCPPPNDNPCNAIVVSVNESDCSMVASGTIFGATASSVPGGSCSGNPDDDVWYKFTALYEVQLIAINNILGGTTNLDHALYEGSCNGLVEVYCSNNTYSNTPILAIGNDYYLRVFSAGNIASTSTFEVCVSQAPENIICEGAIAFCGQGESFVTNNITNTQGFGDIACLTTTSNPTWNFLQIGNSGTIEIEISQNSTDGGSLLDVDFAVWGPFESANQACNNIELISCPTCPDSNVGSDFYPFGNIISCSYSAAAVENFTIENAQSGEIYLLLVTNFTNDSGIITISQTNLDDVGAGSIVADFEIDLGPDINICDTTESITLSAETPFGDTFEWFKDGFFIEEETNSTLTVVEPGNYSVNVINESCETIAMDEVVVAFVDCETTGLIQVSAFFDINNNSVIDDGEANFSNGYFTYEMNADGIVNYVTSSTGNFTIASDNETNTYDISYYFYDEYQDCYNVTTATYNDVTAVIGSEISIEFPIVDDQSCEDIAVQLISNASPRPGFSYLNYISIENLGLVETSGTIEFLMDSDLVLNTIDANPNYTITQNSSGFTLDFVNLPPGFESTIVVSLTCPASVPLGELITNTVTYTTAENDLIAENNTSSLTETVIGAYDPNDIMESHGPQIVFDEFSTSDEYLYYTIRFQNVGTAEAINVRIEDVLDSQLDETAFQMLRSSHDYVVTRTNNQLVWQFDAINLPSENMDEAASMGYVYFKIKPKSGYAIGDIIPNYADIYFDFNLPITTNTFNSEFVETLSVDDFVATQFSLIPNPADNLVILNVKNATDGTITIIDIQGKVIMSRVFSNSSNLQLDISAFESGLYFVKLKTASNETTKKLIIE